MTLARDVRDRIDRLSDAQRAELMRRLRLSTEYDGTADENPPDMLVAFVVPKTGAPTPAAAELRRFLERRLPPFMVPASFVAVSALPTLPNGKVDRQALKTAHRADAPSGEARPHHGVTATHIMKIWDELLDVRQIGLDDNFFELGGHSLLVPRLAERLRQDFGVEVPIGALFESPTVRAMAGIVEAGGTRSSWQLLVPIRERGRRPPLFMVHGLGGEIGYFYNVAEHLHPEQPLYGVQAPPEPFSDMQEMAAHYLQEIRRRQPRGPYMLGGFCLGGSVAFEMARRLVDDGEQVKLVVLIDSVMPGPLPFRRQLRRFVAKPTGEKVRALATRARLALQRATKRGEPEEIPTFYGVPAAFRAIALRHYRAQLNYVPGPFAGRVALLRAPGDDDEADLGWGVVARGGVDVHIVPGPHADVLKPPNVTQTARRLAALVDAAVSRE